MSDLMPFQAQDSLLLQLEKDIAWLQNTLIEKDNIIEEKGGIIVQNLATIVAKDEIIKAHEALIAKLNRMIFGQKRERFEQESPIQLGLFGQMSDEEIVKIEALLEETKDKVKNKEKNTVPRSHPGRKPLSKKLFVVETVLLPTEDVSEMIEVGTEISETLEYKRAEVYIHRIIRPKFAPKAKEGRFLIAPMPESGFPKCIAGTSLIAQILVDKFVDHLPLDRQEKRFKREEIDINSSTLNNWVVLGIERLEILYQYQEKNLPTQKYLQVDETTLKVLDSNKKGASHLGYFWVYYDPLNKNTFFKYEQGRGGKCPTEVIGNFMGYLQTDGYAGYNQLAKQTNIIHLACWAHVRRKFEEALSNDKALAEIGMTLIQKLYEVEREAKDFSPEERKLWRLDKALPIYTLLGKWIAQQLDQTLPKSAIGKALRYAFAQWDELGNYMLDGNLKIDNNLVENAIRPVALGRKNWLFAGNHRAAQRSAIIYTFTSMCKNHDVDPYKAIKYVLENIMTTKPSLYYTLLPQNIKNNPNF
jgi:transposase